MNYARVQDGVVAETFIPPAGVEIGDCFTAELAAQFEPCGADVQSGWIREGKGFAAPAPIVRKADPEEKPQTLADLQKEFAALQAKLAKAMGAKP